MIKPLTTNFVGTLVLVYLSGCSYNSFINDQEDYVEEFEDALSVLSGDEAFVARAKDNSVVILVDEFNHTEYFIGFSKADIVKRNLTWFSARERMGSLFYYQDRDRRVSPTIEKLETVLKHFEEAQKIARVEEALASLDEEISDTRVNVLQTMKLATYNAVLLEELEAQIDTLTLKLKGLNSIMGRESEAMQLSNSKIENQLKTIQVELAKIDKALSEL
ncbi:TPA: hypothetical protein ACX3FX_004450 [Vibrio parahaemolyticus]|uniref:hypothetical protein n=1 Tax=Vibrio sp. Vb0667 TaxID=3074629 RepID=UPI00296B1A32|nr:hypothetical protein [Vibrio sp. Vb0667]MDW3635786.1 hypothetical protein [Vibrio sp. Vb0667]